MHEQIQSLWLKLLDQLNRVVLRPGALVLTQIVRERFNTPRDVGRIANGRERRAALEFILVLNRNRQRTMPAHRMAHDGNVVEISEIGYILF